MEHPFGTVNIIYNEQAVQAISGCNFEEPMGESSLFPFPGCNKIPHTPLSFSSCLKSQKERYTVRRL